MPFWLKNIVYTFLFFFCGIRREDFVVGSSASSSTTKARSRLSATRFNSSTAQPPSWPDLSPFPGTERDRPQAKIPPARIV